MKMKYKCTIEIEAGFNTDSADEKQLIHAKSAVDELIDMAIHDVVFAEVCNEDGEDSVTVTREYLKYDDESVGDEVTAESDEQAEAAAE